MSVKLEFINFIVRVDKIKEKYPGGWEQCLKDHRDSLGKSVWYDEYLFRDGAMNPYDMESILSRWLSLGFDGYFEKDGVKTWGDDMCIVEGLFVGQNGPCDWLAMKIDPHVISVYYKDAEPGAIIGREEMDEYDPALYHEERLGH